MARTEIMRRYLRKREVRYKLDENSGKYVAQNHNNPKRGIMIAFKFEGNIIISWSRCDVNEDKWDNNKAYDMAINRANSFINKMKLYPQKASDIDFYAKTPFSIRKEFVIFADRAARVFQDAKLTPFMYTEVEKFRNSKKTRDENSKLTTHYSVFKNVPLTCKCASTCPSCDCEG
jgi:hypothetical protein